MTPNPIAFRIFGIDIMWYGILISLGILIAIILVYKRAPKYGLVPDQVLDILLLAIPVGIIGARLYYVAFNWSLYQGDFAKIIDIRSGGLAIHGGLIFGAIAAILFAKYKKWNFLNLLDLFAPAVAIAQSIGRWGNYFNSEAHGGPTDLPWAITVMGEKVHPTFLYESLWCLGLFIFLIAYENRRKFKGQIFFLYGILYSVERFFVEGLRTDSLMIGPFRQAQMFSLFIIIAFTVAYVYLYKKNKENKI